MQTTAIRTVANPLPENEIILLTLLISKRYIPYTDLRKNMFITFDKTKVVALFLPEGYLNVIFRLINASAQKYKAPS